MKGMDVNMNNEDKIQKKEYSKGYTDRMTDAFGRIKTEEEKKMDSKEYYKQLRERMMKLVVEEKERIVKENENLRKRGR